MSGQLAALQLFIEKAQSLFDVNDPTKMLDPLVKAAKIMSSFDYDPGKIVTACGEGNTCN